MTVPPALPTRTRRSRPHRLALAVVAAVMTTGLIAPNVAFGAFDPACACGGGGGGSATPGTQSIVTPPATAGQPFSTQLTNSYGDPSSWEASSTPPGLSLSPAGVLSGTPTAAGRDQHTRATATYNGYPYIVDVYTTVASRAPGAPRSVAAVTTSSSTASVTWAAPADVGEPALTAYRITWDGGSRDVPASQLSLAVTGLTTGRSYQFSVSTVSDTGVGAPVASGAVTTASAPAAPTGLAAVLGAGSVALSWTASATNGAPVTGYLIEQQPAGGAWTPATPASVTGTAATVTGLTNGTAYAFRVSATSSAGTSPASASTSQTPSTVPAAPTVRVFDDYDGKTGVAWAAGTSDGGSPLIRWQLDFSGPDGTRSTSTTAPTTLSTTYAGLTTGVTYTVTVRAVNARGASDPATTTVTPYTVPGAPARVQVTPRAGSLAVQWDAVPLAGAPSVSYRVRWSSVAGSGVEDVSSTSTVITGLTDGLVHDVSVQALNPAGSGPATTQTGTPRRAPDSPTGVTTSPDDASTTVRWAGPAFDGGSPVTGWVVQLSRDAGTSWSTTTAAAEARSTTIDGLANGVRVLARVAAVNAAGTGAVSATATAVPYGVPEAPSDLTASPSDRGVALRWAAAAGNGSPVTGYRVTTRSPDGSTTTQTVTTASATVTDLVNGWSYRFTVTAVNARGESLVGASVTEVPRTLPAAPADLTVTPGSGSAALRWSASDDGGSPITGYQVDLFDGTSWLRVAVTSTPGRTVTGLLDGREYGFRVTAVNAVGTSSASQVVRAVPRSAPGAPTITSATPSDGRVAVAWSPPTDDGGAAVDGYVLEVRDGSGDVRSVDLAGTGLTTTVDGLRNGTAYSVQVSATTVAGVGTASTAVAVTPRTTPGAPADLALAARDGAVAASWTVPTDTGGDDVAGYLVERRVDGAWITVVGAESTTASINGLVNGTPVEIRVRAVNDAGPGLASAGSTATPRTTPDQPGTPTATPGAGSVELTWAAPAFDGGSVITSYDVEASRDGALWARTATVAATTVVVRGLDDGTPYSFRVTPVNEAGPGTASEPTTAVPRTTATAPVDLEATPGDGQVDLAWAEPLDDGGARVTGYVVQHLTRGGAWADVATVAASVGGAPSPAVVATVTGLANGTAASFRVSAVNAGGTGAASDTVTVTPRRTADEPRDLAATPGDRSVTLRWSAPLTDGGAPIVSYDVQASGADGSWTSVAAVPGTSDLAVTVGELANGTERSFRVRALNDAGVGAWSAVVASTPFVFAPEFSRPDGVSLVGATLVVGDAVVFTADHLPVGATVTLELHSVVRVLATGEVGADGTIRLVGVIPADAEAGAHELVAVLDGVGTTIAPVSVDVRIDPVVVPALGPGSLPGLETATVPGTSVAPVVTAASGTSPIPVGDLAYTGADGAAAALASALALVLAGAWLRLQSRRRAARS